MLVQIRLKTNGKSLRAYYPTYRYIRVRLTDRLNFSVYPCAATIIMLAIFFFSLREIKLCMYQVIIDKGGWGYRKERKKEEDGSILKGTFAWLHDEVSKPFSQQ